MSFFSGLATGVMTSIDRTLQRELQETRDYNKEINKIRFKEQMEEKDEWDDDVEEARKALENGASVFTMPDGSIDPRGVYYAAAALKRSGSLNDYNAFIANLKTAKSSGDINPIEYFSQLPEDYTIASAKDYAQAFVGPMADYSEIEPYSIKTPALKFLSNIMGKPLNSRKQMNKILEQKLKAAGIDNMAINSSVSLPTLNFLDYKFTLEQLDPSSRITKIKSELMKPEINKSYNADKKEYYLNMRKKTLDIIKAEGNLTEQIEANQLVIDSLDNDNPEDAAIILELQQENVQLNDTKKRRELVLDGNPLKIIDHDIDILLREIEQVKNSSKSDKNSTLASLKEELNKKKEEKYSIAMRSDTITNDEKLKLMKKRFARLVNNPDYVNSEDAKVDELAIFNLQRDINLLNIGPFSAEKMNDWEIKLQTHIYKELQKNIDFKKFLEFSQDGLATVTINTGAIQKHASATGADPDAIISNLKAAKINAGKNWLDQRLEIFEEKFEPELFKVAEIYYADPRNNLGKIDESFRKSYEMRGSIIDDLRKGKLEEDSDDNASGKQTEKILESSDITPPVKKPSIAERRIAAGQTDFTLTDTGIDNFVKESLKIDKNATASEIVEALEKLHEDKNLKISNEQLSLIKSKIVDYSEPTSTSVTVEEKSSESSNVLKDMINNIPKIPGKAFSAYQRSRVINTAKQEYNKLRDKQDISATRKQSDILEDLKIFLRDNNYSSDEIRYEIENIVRPVKKLMKNSSGGLMSRS